MSFLTPFAFALMGLVPVVVAMYLLKLRRTERAVSSTYLWRRMVRDVEANAPWQRLRRNLLLLLQILFLLAVIFALARPFTWTETGGGQTTILILDPSASMAATDVRPSRLEAAKDQARLLIDNLPAGARATLITAGEPPQVLVSASQDKRQLQQALEGVQTQPGGGDLTGALELASAIAARQADSEIVILSDGRVQLPERLALPGRVRYLPVGESGDNQAILQFSLEAGNPPETLTAFLRVNNYAAETVRRRLTLTADGLPIDVQDLEIPGGGSVTVISEGLPAGLTRLEAALEGTDALPLDDRAWAVPPDSGRGTILLLTPGNRFLETALTLLPGVEVTVRDPKSGTPDTETPPPPSVLILDRTPPPLPAPRAPLFFHAPLASSGFFSVTGIISAPVPLPADPADTLLRHADLSAVSILDAARIPLPDWARPVLVDETSGAPLLFVGEPDGRRVAVLAFDPLRSDLPLQPAYPILIANLMDYLLPGKIGEIPASVQPGEALTFTPPPGVTSLTVTRPDGTTLALEPDGGRAVFADTAALGVYTVNWETGETGGGQLAFAVNLFSPQESDIRPAETLPLLTADSGGAEAAAPQGRREWWRPLALLALGLIFGEWVVYNRSTLFKLWQQVKP